MKKKVSIFLILLLFLFALTGCYDASSIEDAYYVVALGIDQNKNESYNISIQIAKNTDNKSSLGSSQSSAYNIYTVEAETVDSAISIFNNYLNKKINLSHCSAIIFSEELARQGIGHLVNSLANHDEIRPNAYVLISDEDAINILENVSSSGENFSSRFYEYIINSSDYSGFTTPVTFAQFLTDINDQFGDGIAIYTTVTDNIIQNNGIAIFRDDYMVGHSYASDSIAHLLITNQLKESIITLDNPFEENSKIDLFLGIRKNCNPKVEIINGTPFISIDIFTGASIKTSGENFDYTSTENIKIVEKHAKEYLENLISNYLYTLSKEYDSDIFNFQSMYSKKCLTNQELEKVHFDEVYKDSFFDINVDVEISSTHLFDKE